MVSWEINRSISTLVLFALSFEYADGKIESCLDSDSKYHIYIVFLELSNLNGKCQWKNMIFLIFLLKNWIVGTR